MFDIFKKSKYESYQKYDKRIYGIASKGSKYVARDGTEKDFSDYTRAKAAGVVEARKAERQRAAYKKAKAEGRPFMPSAEYKRSLSIDNPATIDAGSADRKARYSKAGYNFSKPTSFEKSKFKRR